MSLEILVTTQDALSDSLTLPTGRKVYETLGPSEGENTTVFISELLKQVFEQVQKSLEFECTVEVTISGSLSITGKGDAKFLIFNVGGEEKRETTMSVKVLTSLKP